MNQTQNPSNGLMQQASQLSSLREQIRSSLGPRKAPLSLDEHLAQLSEQELTHLLSIAKMVKVAHGFGANRNRSYVDLIREMYPRFHSGKREVIAAMMQDADPIENTALTPAKPSLDYTDAALDEWSRAIDEPEPAPVQGLSKQAVKPNRATPVGPYKDKEAFIAAITPAAKAAAARLNIDPKIIIAQSALETGWGKSVKGNSYFGIKAHGSDKTVSFNTHEEDAAGLMRKQKDSFRAYDNLDDSVPGYAEFISNNPRYKPMLEAKTTEEQISALGETGYATDSKYGEKIRSIVKGLEA
jgi:flagellum-specific peptidoglycan hydrolase FlgJ